jgi:ABC-type nitrate/sulfonate/bicarbonate transport system substrate-binding protein
MATISKLAVAALLVLTSACGSEPDTSGSGIRTLRVAHNSNAAALPLQVAMTEGIFAKHHLKIEFTKVENITNLPGTLGRSFDVVLSSSATVIAAAGQGIPVTQVAGATIDVKDNPTGYVIGSRSAGVTDVKHLAGKTIGVLTETGTAHLATKAWMKQEGVDLTSVKAVQVDGPTQADQFAAGRVDAVETVEPFAANVLRNPNAVNLGDPHLKLAPELSTVTWIALQDFAKQNTGVLDDFRAALGEAQDFIAANDGKARQVLKQFTGLPDAVITSTKLPTYTTEIRPQDLRIWLRTMQDVAGFTGDVDLDALTSQSGR